MVMKEEEEDTEERERWLGDGGGRDRGRIKGPGEFYKNAPSPSYCVPSRSVFGTARLIHIPNSKLNR